MGPTGSIVRSRRGHACAALAGSIVLASGALGASQVAFGWGSTTPSVTHFAMALPVPATLAPTSTDATTDYYTLTEKQASVPMIPGVLTPAWTYNGTVPGPTIVARSGRQVKVHVVNTLAEATSTHLHGAHVPSGSDGGPMDLVQPGSSYDYLYPNNQSGRMQWYHDHAMDVTAKHVWNGLAGVYLIKDAQEDALNLPSGAQDVPLAIMDRNFNADGTMPYTDGKGNVTLVNGAAFPYFKVTARKYRFRVLNASNISNYDLHLSNGATMVQVGNEAGLLRAPAGATDIPLAPAERADIIVDFSKVAVGTSVRLTNGGSSSGYSWNGDTYGDGGDIMRFDVTGTATDTSVVPASLRSITPLDKAAATVTRTFTLGQDRNNGWTINGLAYDMNRVDVAAKLGSTEIWKFDNRSGTDHPMHLHDINFQVLDVNGAAPSAANSGWKETVDVPKWGSATIIVRWDDYTGRYVFHCHKLEHEDNRMMGNIQVS